MEFLTQEELDILPWIPDGNKFLAFPRMGKKPQIGHVLTVQDGKSIPDEHFGLINVVATVHDEQNKHFGKLIKYQSQTGVIDTIYISNKTLKNRTNPFDDLVDRGYFIHSDPEIAAKLQKYFYLAKVNKFVPYVTQTGYSKKFHAFMLPDGMHTKDGKKLVVYEKNGDDLPLNVSGSYDTWKNEIAGIAAKYSIPTFSLCVAFSSMLFPFVDLGTIFVHFYGLSGKGKTLLLQMAASVFGRGSDPRTSPNFKSLISQWNATPTGLEGMAALYNGTLGLIDELHKCDDKNFPNAIYALCGGVNKTRGKPTGELQKQQTWVFPALSSGEQSGLEKINRSKEEATLGRLIRFLDIHVDFQYFNDLENSAAEILASELKRKCTDNYGHAARDFMQQLLALSNDYESLKQLINDEKDLIHKKLYSVDAPTEEIRVMHHFALFALAGYYAVRFNILPMTEEEVFSSVCFIRDIWLEHMKTYAEMAINQQTKETDYVNILRKSIIGNIHLYQETTDTKPKANCNGYIKTTKDGGKTNAYLLLPDTFEDIFKGCKIEVVINKLIEGNILIPEPDKKHNTIRYRIKSITGKDGNSAVLRLYTIDSSIIDDQNTVNYPLELSEKENELILEYRKNNIN